MPHDPADALGETAQAPPSESAERLPSSDTLSRGASIGRYLVLDRLGQGGMGVVYAAYDPELNRKVAIKLLREAKGSLDGTQGRLRLLREAQAMARLSHPNVISVFDVGSAFDQVFVAMEFIDGGTLSERLAKRPHPIAEILELFHQAGRGLAAAHAAGLIHRDFKPDNVLTSSDGRVRVTDFGLVREAGSSDPVVPTEVADKTGRSSGGLATSGEEKMTQAGAMLGTPLYMAPEQFRGELADARTDQFNFCVALYEAVHGVRPFAGSSLAELRANVIEGNVRSPPAGKQVPAWLHKVILRGLSVNTQDRFPNMDALLRLLSPEARRARRQKLLFGGAAAVGILLLLGGYSGLHWQKERAARRCDDSAARLSQVFGEDTKERARQALLATGKPDTAVAFSRVVKNVESYLAEWRTLRKETCRATYVSGQEPLRLHDRKMRCLDSRLQEVSAFTSLILKAESDIVERVAETSSSFTPLADCADNATLYRLVAEQPEVRERVDSLTRELAEIRMMTKLARYDQAKKRAAAALRVAEQLGYAPAAAAAHQSLATIENDNSDFTLAEREYFAMAVSGINGGDHRAAAVGFLELFRIYGRHRKEFEQADHYRVLALAELNHAAGGEKGWKAEFQARQLFYQCQVDSAHKEFGKAIKACQEALRLCREGTRAGSELHIEILVRLGNLHRRQDHLGEAVALYQEALSLSEQVYGAILPNVDAELGNVGSELPAERKYQESATYLAKVTLLYKRIFGERHPKLFNLLMAQSRLAYRQKRWDEATAFAKQAQELASEFENPKFLAMAMSLHGDIFYRQGKYAEAKAQHELSLKHCDPSRCEAETPAFLIALGDDLRGLGDSRAALPILEEALRLQPKTADRALLARNQFSLAQAILFVEKKHGQARAVLLAERAMELYKLALQPAQAELLEVADFLSAQRIKTSTVR